MATGDRDCFGAAALEALAANDADMLKQAYQMRGSNVDAVVRGGSYGGSTKFNGMSFQEGDTMMHLALRNKKWKINETCIATLECDVCHTASRTLQQPIVSFEHRCG